MGVSVCLAGARPECTGCGPPRTHSLALLSRTMPRGAAIPGSSVYLLSYSGSTGAYRGTRTQPHLARVPIGSPHRPPMQSASEAAKGARDDYGDDRRLARA